MFKYIISGTVPFLFAAMCTMSACKDRDDTLDRDLQMVGETAAGAVDLRDEAMSRTGGTAKTGTTTSGTAAKSTSGGTKTTSSTGGSTVRTGTISTGSSIRLASSSRVCTNTHKAQDTFNAVVKESVTGSNGAVLPAGSIAKIQITSLSRKSNAGDRVEMGFLVQSLTVGGKTYPVDSRITAVQVVEERSSSNRDAQKVIGGAVIGAVIGQVIGKDTKSTVIGAATGAAAGTVVAMVTGDYEGCVPEGGNITIALNSPLTITVASE